MIIQNVLPAIHLPSTSPGSLERAEANSSQLLYGSQDTGQITSGDPCALGSKGVQPCC